MNPLKSVSKLKKRLEKIILEEYKVFRDNSSYCVIDEIHLSYDFEDEEVIYTRLVIRVGYEDDGEFIQNELKVDTINIRDLDNKYFIKGYFNSLFSRLEKDGELN